jgi:hypothetical protein
MAAVRPSLPPRYASFDWAEKDGQRLFAVLALSSLT